MYIELFINKMKKLNRKSKSKSKDKNKQIELWFKELYSKKDNLLSIKNSWKKSKDNKRKRP